MADIKLNPPKIKSPKNPASPVKGFEGYTPAAADAVESSILRRLDRALEFAKTALALINEEREKHSKSHKTGMKARGKTSKEIAAEVNGFYIRGGAIDAAKANAFNAASNIQGAIDNLKTQLSEYGRSVCKIYIALREGENAGKKGDDLITEEIKKDLVKSDQVMVNSLFMIGFCESMAANAGGTASMFSAVIKGKLEELKRKHDSIQQGEESAMRNHTPKIVH